MRNARATALMALLVTAVLTPSGPASASTPDAPVAEVVQEVVSAADPQQAFEALSPQQQQEYITAASELVPDRTVTARTVRPAAPSSRTSTLASPLDRMTGAATLNASKCWNATTTATDTSVGVNLYRYWQTSTWCWNGSYIYMYGILDKGGQPILPGWTYGGVVQYGSAKISDKQVRSRTQFKFTFGVPGVISQEKQPCLRQANNNFGASYLSYQCSLHS